MVFSQYNDNENFDALSHLMIHTKLSWTQFSDKLKESHTQLFAIQCPLHLQKMKFLFMPRGGKVISPWNTSPELPFWVGGCQGKNDLLPLGYDLLPLG